MRLGIIDIGSNTIRLVVWELYGKGFYRIIEEIKENVRIGQDGHIPVISEEKIIAALAVLKKFKKFAANLQVGRTIVVATDPVRRVDNREDFLERIRLETGYVPIVLNEYEESYMDFRGVTGSMEVQNSLMVDIGGSSTELVWIRNNELMESASIPYGTLTLTERYHLEDIVTSANHQAMDQLLDSEFRQIPWLFSQPFKTMILVGGSARAIGRMDRNRKHYPLSLTHNYTLLDLDINMLYTQLMTKNAHGRARLPGLEMDRADVILGAMAIIKSLCGLTGLTELRVSGNGLREGILYEHIRSNYEYYPERLDASIYSILARHNMDVAHAEHVYKLSNKLFQALQDEKQFPAEWGDVLKCAAMLHDTGMSIRYYDHERHSFYLILNSEINGLNHREILMAALAASFHRKNNDDLPLAPYSHLINRLDINIAERLGLLIALAETFEKNLNGHIFDLDVEVRNDQITVFPISYEDLETELAEASKLIPRFSQVFRKNLEIIPRILTQEPERQDT